MKQKNEKRAAAQRMLRRIEQYSTLTAFTRMYYAFLCDLCDAPEVRTDALGQALYLMLRCEHRRHRCVGEVIRDSTLSVRRVVNTGFSVQHVLRAVRSTLRHLDIGSVHEDILRLLLLGECCMQLELPDEAAYAFRQAAELGCDHPMVWYALGISLYNGSLRSVQPETREAELLAIDRAGFEKGCAEAIWAFRQGLSGSLFDGRLHWWMARVFEILGDFDSACDEYMMAGLSDPPTFERRARRRIRLLVRDHAVTRPEHLSSVGPITEEEIDEARQLLARTNPFPAEFFQLP